MKNTMSATETAKHLRNELKAAGIRARVHVAKGGNDFVTVAVPNYEARFTSEEIHTFCTIAKDAGLTFVRGIEIEPEVQSYLIGSIQWDFYL